jgi:hypothetical protein
VRHHLEAQHPVDLVVLFWREFFEGIRYQTGVSLDEGILLAFQGLKEFASALKRAQFALGDFPGFLKSGKLRSQLAPGSIEEIRPSILLRA